MAPSPRRALCAALLSTAALAAAADGAFAATLTYAGGTLTFTGGGAVNDVTFTETAANTVRVDRDTADTPPDADPITSVPGNCEEVANDETYDCTGVTRVVANTGGGDDEVDASGLTTIPIEVNAGEGDDTAIGGGGEDVLVGNGGADDLQGGPGDDSLDGGVGADTLAGGAGNDLLDGTGGDDIARGGDGDDLFRSEDGDDVHDGGAGADTFLAGAGDDELIGGTGYDVVVGQPTGTPPASLSITLDDVANDRTTAPSGEVDNVRADVEAVDLSSSGQLPSGDDLVIGNAAANSISAGAGNDTIDGGTGNDVLTGGAGNDTIRARDGYADFVNCGEGADTAEVDTLDTVQECETVNRADVGNANDVPEDRAPGIDLIAPAPGSTLRTNGPTTLTATATDDRGIAQVLFVDDDRVVCTDTEAPYTCDYQPRGEDVGRNTLVAIAIDTAQQSTSAIRTFNVGRFAVGGITGAVTPARDTRRPFVFRTTGRLRLPALVSPAVGCRGIVSVQVKAGAKTISTRRANVRRNCAFTSVVQFAGRRRFTRSGRLRFTIRFTGNEVLGRSVAVARNVRTR